MAPRPHKFLTAIHAEHEATMCLCRRMLLCFVNGASAEVSPTLCVLSGVRP